MRLIDADELINQGYEIVVDGLQYDTCNKSIDIDDIPTAYSVDKVVEELELIRAKKTCNKEKCDTKELCRICVVDDAIEIVKRGGVFDDVCEWKADCHLENDNPAKWLICPHNPKRIFSTDIKYCPYCGKKIKEKESD